MFALRLTETGNKPMYKRIAEIRNSCNHLPNDLIARQQSIRSSNGTKFSTYARLNPSLETHSIYSGHHTLPDNLRIGFTRFRTSSHRLRVELGRWSRTPREQRTCACGSGDIQDEDHVFSCERTRDVRRAANFDEGAGCPELFADASFKNLIMLKECMKI